MKIHALASLPHYRDHVEAIHKHLPDEIRGDTRYGARVSAKGWPEDDFVMVGGFYDVDAVPQRIIYVEHGAGQSYRGDPRSSLHPAYHGSPHHPSRVCAYLSPRLEVAQSWNRPAFPIGAPVCDPYAERTNNDKPIAVITFHWNAQRICPEAGSALFHYADDFERIIASLRLQGFDVYGHHHPRDHRLPLMWKRLDVPVLSIEAVRRGADLLICDNSSLMYEMCYLGRTVVALNCPEYRREVEHGLRFWDWRGPQIDGPEELIAFNFADMIRRGKKVNFDDTQIRFDTMWNAKAAYGKPRTLGHDGELAAEWVTMIAPAL